MVAHARRVELQALRVLRVHGKLNQQRQGFFQIVAHIDRAAALFRDGVHRFALAIEQALFVKMRAAKALQRARPLQPVRAAQQPVRQREQGRAACGIVDVGILHGIKMDHVAAQAGKDIEPAFAQGAIQPVAIMQERLRQGHGGKSGDARPAVARVVAVAAALAYQIGFRPVHQFHGGAQICFASGLRPQGHQRIREIRAAAMDDVAGGAQQATVQVFGRKFFHLVSEQRVAPGLHQSQRPFFSSCHPHPSREISRSSRSLHRKPPSLRARRTGGPPGR